MGGCTHAQSPPLTPLTSNPAPAARPQIPAFICNDVQATAPCSEFTTDEEPNGIPGECTVYIREISFLTAVTFIASPSSSNGSYVRSSSSAAFLQRSSVPKLALQFPP